MRSAMGESFARSPSSMTSRANRPAIEVDTSLPGERVVRVLERLADTRGLPKAIVCDNGPEFRGEALDQWADRRGVALQFIQPGKPIQNAFAESFNGRLRDECLNESWFVSLARCAADDRGVADRLQCRSAAQRPRRSNPGGVCERAAAYCNFTPPNHRTDIISGSALGVTSIQRTVSRNSGHPRDGAHIPRHGPSPRSCSLPSFVGRADHPAETFALTQVE